MGKGIKHKDVGGELTYAEFHAEDAHELASGTSFPASPSEGDLFYHTDQHKWYIYDGTAWKEMTAQPLIPIVVSMHQQKKDYADTEVYASPVSEHSCVNPAYHNYASSITFNETLNAIIKASHIYRCKLSALIRAGTQAYYSYAAVSIDGGGEVGEVSRAYTDYAWTTSGEFDVKYGQTVQCRHRAYDGTHYGYIKQWKLLVKSDAGFFEITPANQGFVTLKCIQILLNQNDQAKITKMDDTTETYSNSAAACLACPIEGIGLPKDVLPIQLKKIEWLAGSPIVMICDGG